METVVTAEEWAEALLSGEYKQGTRVLRLGGRFCCLGVLCDLYVKKGVGHWDENLYILTPYPGASGDAFYGVPPGEFLDRMGFDCMEGNFTRMNDEQEYSFNEIAGEIKDMLND